jgi:4'-phosphopantetheinyl transferase
MPLPADELHVWRACLERSPEVTAALHAVLSADERDRAGRFYLPQHGARYVVGRGLLRVLLATYLGIRPEHVEFAYGEHGKPLLRDPPSTGPTGPDRSARRGPGRLWFNLAHSGAEAVYAFSASAEVGVDVELLDMERTHGRVAERFFAPGEVHSLRSLPSELQPKAFLHGWTRKEAFIKARGDGLSLPLNSFEVTLAPRAAPAVLRTAWSATEPAEWSVIDLSEPERGVIAAAAGRYRGWRVVRRSADELADQAAACHKQST